MTSIFLIGSRGSGKTTVGSHLARLLNCPLVDTDSLILEEAGVSVTEIVAHEGWPGFRRREARALVSAISSVSGGVVCTGGGIVLDPANVALMRQHGIVIYLHTPAAVLHARLSNAGAVADRPSLTGADPLQEISSVLAQREPLYRVAAHVVVNAARSPGKVALLIMKKIALAAL